MHLDDRLRSLKELIDEKSEMAGHLSRDINSGNQMAMYLEMHSMNNRDIPDEFEDKAEREAASRRKIDRTVSTMNKMVQTKEAKSRAALKELLERDGSKLKAYLDRASCLVQMIRELQAAQASGGDTSSIEQELHGALTKRTQGARRPVPRARSQPLRWIAPARRSRSTSPPPVTPLLRARRGGVAVRGGGRGAGRACAVAESAGRHACDAPPLRHQGGGWAHRRCQLGRRQQLRPAEPVSQRAHVWGRSLVRT